MKTLTSNGRLRAGSQQAAVAVADDDGIREAEAGQVPRRQFVVLETLGHGLESAAHRLSAGSGAQGVVPSPIEGEDSQPCPGKGGRQETGRAGIEVHLVAVKVEGGGCRLPVRPVHEAVQRIGRRRDAHQLQPHAGVSPDSRGAPA